MIYGSWDMKHNRLNFLSFWTIFCPFTSLKTWKIKILKKWKQQKKMLGDIIILYMCTINENHMMYGSWDMEHDRPFFFLILDHFVPFYPPNKPENQNFEKREKTPGDIILHKCTKNHDDILYLSLDMVLDKCKFYFSFWAFFCPFTPLTAGKFKI